MPGSAVTSSVRLITSDSDPPTLCFSVVYPKELKGKIADNRRNPGIPLILRLFLGFCFSVIQKRRCHHRPKKAVSFGRHEENSEHSQSAFKVAHLAAGGSQVKDASGGPAGGQPFKKVAKQVFKKGLGSI